MDGIKKEQIQLKNKVNSFDKNEEEDIKPEGELKNKVDKIKSGVNANEIPDYLSNFFSNNGLYVISKEVIRKNKEMNFVI